MKAATTTARGTRRKPARPAPKLSAEDAAIESDESDPDYGPPERWPAWTDNHRYAASRRTERTDALLHLRVMACDYLTTTTTTQLAGR